MEKRTERTAAAPLFRRHVRRLRLTALLDESTAQAIVLAAPAGYGKTVLAQEWLTDHPRAAWYRASPSSADVAAFSVGVADAVKPIVPNAGDRLRQRLRVADTPEKLVRPLAELLAEDLASWPEDAWLVVDDYHLVTDSAAVEEFVDWLLTLAPVRLLVTTRRRPSWASARRVLYGEITEIGRDQLAMTNDEASRVLDGRPSEAVRALVSQAEGWPALIGLAALSASSELPRERVSDALFRYFAEEVFRREPPDVQHFMLVASIPVSLSVETVRDVLGFPDAEPLLQRLTDDGLLHESDDGLRFHPLVRDFLRRKVEFEHSELVARLRERTVADARRRERWDEAFALAVDSGQPDKMAAIIGAAAPSLLAAGQVEMVEKWLSSSGPALGRDPAALFARADLLIRQGRFLEAAAIARQLAKSLEPDDPSVSRAWLVAGRASHLASDPGEAVTDHIRAREAAQRPEDLRNALWGAFVAASELEVPNLETYLNAFEEAVDDDVDGKLQIAIGRLNVASNHGTLKGTSPLIQSVRPLAAYSADPMVQSSFMTCAAYLNVGRANYDLAREFAADAVRFCTELRLDFAIGYALIQRAASEIGLRHFRLARATLKQVSQIGESSSDKYLRLEQRSHEVKLMLAMSDPGAVRLDVDQLDNTDQPSQPFGAYLGLNAIAAAAAGDIERALQFAQEARRVTRRVEASYYGRFAEAIIRIRESGTRNVADEVAVLIASAIEDEFLDGFVVAYRAFPPMLDVVVTVPAIFDLVRDVVMSAHDTTLAHAAGLGDRGRLPDDDDSPIAPLTRRETQVLELLGQGLSNREIAQTLVISPSTAKVHVRHILGKLQARTRVEAALAARDLARRVN